MTLAEAMDQVRRMLGVLPARDLQIPGASPGQASTQQPRPPNPELIQCIMRAARTVNRKVGFTGTSTPFPVAISSQTAYGPLRLDLSRITAAANPNQISTISRAFWADDSTNTARRYRIKATTLSDLDRQGIREADAPPASRPEWFSVDSYNLVLVPPPNQDGVVYLECGLSLSVPEDLQESFVSLPFEYIDVLLDAAVVEVCIANPANAQYQERLKVFIPKLADGIHDMKVWMNNNMDQYESRFGYEQFRKVWGGRTR